jgi:signal transduction histidine kinase
MLHHEDPSEVATRLAGHLSRRRSALLAEWRRRVEADAALTTVGRLSRLQFEDHVPQVLDAFERRLRELDRPRPRIGDSPAQDAAQSAEDHGLQRWQQGYDQRETIREWHHLQLCLLDEIDRFETDVVREPRTLSAGRRALTELCMQGIERSAARFMQMHRAEAAVRLHDLEQAMSHLVDIEAQRAAVLREAAHDLRGNVGTLRTASTVLARHDLSQDVRAAASGALYRGVASLHELLTDLLDLSRLDAGLERRVVAPFDAARLLADLCDTMQPVADEAGLFLRYDGAAALPVRGDPVKVRRIAQNLMLNALRCTQLGGVVVHGAPCERTPTTSPCWALTVQDTGPGIPEVRSSPLAQHLKDATDVSAELAHLSASTSADGDAGRPALLASQSIAPDARLAARAPGGEGLGMAIVKRLCELLDAGIELDTAAGRGTTFRIVFPSAYPH